MENHGHDDHPKIGPEINVSSSIFAGDKPDVVLDNILELMAMIHHHCNNDVLKHLFSMTTAAPERRYLFGLAVQTVAEASEYEEMLAQLPPELAEGQRFINDKIRACQELIKKVESKKNDGQRLSEGETGWITLSDSNTDGSAEESNKNE